MEFKKHIHVCITLFLLTSSYIGNSQSVGTSTVQTPDICLATVDSLSINNEIYWQKNFYPEADSFIVYRETSPAIYSRIAGISKNAPGMYIDINRSIGPINGDPNVSANKYKLQIRDTLGNYSALSKYHQTIYIIDHVNGTFSWNSYAIEANVSLAPDYILVRKNIISGTETVLGNTLGNLLPDIQYILFAPLGYKWFVQSFCFSCDPSAKLIGNGGDEIQSQKVKTKSNHANDFIVTLVSEDKSQLFVKVYPNPAKNSVNVRLNNHLEIGHVDIKDALGQVVLSI